MKLFAANVQIFVGVAILAESPSTAFWLHDLKLMLVDTREKFCISFTYSFRDLLESLVLTLLENVVSVQIQQLELPLDHLMVADVTESRTRLRMFGVENVRQRSVERHAIVRRALFAWFAVAGHRRSLLIRLSSAVRPTVLRVSFLDRLALCIDAPAAVVFKTLNGCVGSVLAAFRDELYLRSLS